MKTTLKFIAFSIALWIVSNTTAHAQNLPYSNVCTSGAKNAITSGLPSSNLLLSSYTYCLVTVYNTGTTTPATIFSNASGSVLSNPFFASAITGQYTFYIAANSVVDITMSGGNPSPGITTPYTFSVALGGGGGSGGSCGTGTNLFLMIWTGASSCGASPIYTDATGNAVLNIPFSSSVNVYSPELNLFGTPGMAGAVALSQGTSSAPSAGQVQISAPTSVTAYSLSLPPAQGTGNLYNPGNGILEWDSTLFQANGTALQNQNTINYVGAGNTTVSNPSAGEVLISSTGTQLQMGQAPPITGQYVIIYPTVFTKTSSGVGASNSQIGPVGSLCSGGGSGQTVISGFSLPDGISPSNVTAVYAVAYTSNAFTIPASPNPCAGFPTSPRYMISTLVASMTPSNDLEPNLGIGGWGTTYGVANLATATGANIGSITLTAVGDLSGDFINPGSTFQFFNIALLVYYTGTPYFENAPINVISPLTWDAETQDLGFNPLYMAPGRASRNVSALPAPSLFAGDIIDVNDGTTTTDCTTGGGSAAVHECVSNGTSWAAFGGGGGSGTVNSGTSGQVAYYAATGTAVSGETTVTPAQGGTGTSTAPTDAQILIGQSGGSYLPKTVSGSCTVSDTGVFSCSSGTFAAHQWLGNNTGTSSTGIPSLIGVSDISPNTYAVDTGVVNAAVVDLIPPATALVAGLTFSFLPIATNTISNPSVNLNGLGAVTITHPGGNPLNAGDMQSNVELTVKYNSVTSTFEIQNQGECGVGDIPCTNTANSFTTGTQTFIAGTPSTVATVVRGSGSGFGTIAVIQSTPSFNTTQALTSNVTAGDSILVLVTGVSGNVPGVPTDTLGNTYVLMGQQTSTPLDYVSAAYLAYSPSGGADTVNLNSSCCAVGGYAIELSNILPIGAGDGSVVVGASSTPTSVTSGTINTTQAGDIIFNVSEICCSGNVSGLTVSGYTNLPTSTTNMGGSVYYAQQSSVGAFNSTWTQTGSASAYLIFSVALKAAATTQQTADLVDYELYDSSIQGGVNRVGQQFLAVTAGCPTNTPSIGTLAYDSTAQDICKYTTSGWVHEAGSPSFAAGVNCIAASGSATAYSCITTNVFTPASGDSVLLKVDVANTGSATLSVNGATAATITKTGGTVNLSGSELHVGQWLWMIFDGTNWQAQLTN